MGDITSTALQDAVQRKHELAAEVDRLRVELAKAVAQNVKWEQTCIEVHDARMAAERALESDRERLNSMSLCGHLRIWWNRP